MIAMEHLKSRFRVPCGGCNFIPGWGADGGFLGNALDEGHHSNIFIGPSSHLDVRRANG